MKLLPILFLALFATLVTADPSDVVPELVETQIESPLNDITDVYDDPTDQHLAVHPTADSEGNNPVTGQKVTKTSNGMKDKHKVWNPVLHRNFVKPAGYTSKDARLTKHGHYYLGSGRRRIGAGFGRRRRATEEKPSRKQVKAAFKKLTDPMFADPKKLKKLRALAKMFKVPKSGKVGKKKKKKWTKQELRKLAAYVMGTKRGPTFFAGNNFKGASYTARKSLKSVKQTGKLQNADISSVKVPPGWCITLYAKKNWAGPKLKICGPKKRWSLQKYPLTLHYGEHRVNKWKTKGYRTKTTTWDNMAYSFKVTKYAYKRHKPTGKCKKTCGVKSYVLTGKVTCQQSRHVEKKKAVSTHKCKSVGLRKPSAPTKRCPSTPACVEFKTSPPAGKCVTKCGTKAHTLKGKVYCQEKVSGKKVSNSKCTYWKLSAPLVPTKRCPSTPACVEFKTSPTGKCVTKCGTKAHTLKGKVYCQEKVSGKKVSNSKCTYWKLSAPLAPTKKCPATRGCYSPLACTTSKKKSNHAGVIKPNTPRGGYTLVGGGMNNHYRTFNKLSAFEEAFPKGNQFQCDTGFGPGRLTCYARYCKATGLKCVTRKSSRQRKSGTATVSAPNGYVMTGGGLYNHYRHFNKKAHFERSHPSGNGWIGDMGYGWGDWTVYVRACKGVTCKTVQSGVGNSKVANCPRGYTVMSCGSHQKNGWGTLGAFEQYNFHGNGCHCDMGFGSGKQRCYARCCKGLGP